MHCKFRRFLLFLQYAKPIHESLVMQEFSNGFVIPLITSSLKGSSNPFGAFIAHFQILGFAT